MSLVLKLLFSLVHECTQVYWQLGLNIGFFLPHPVSKMVENVWY